MRRGQSNQKLLVRSKQDLKATPLFFTIDGIEHEGAIKFFSYNCNDHSAVIVLTDDDGHTRVIDSEETLQKYMDEVGADGDLYVAAESPQYQYSCSHGVAGNIGLS